MLIISFFNSHELVIIMKYGVQVREIMSRRIIKAKPSDGIVKAARIMKSKKVGALGIFDGKILN